MDFAIEEVVKMAHLSSIQTSTTNCTSPSVGVGFYAIVMHPLGFWGTMARSHVVSNCGHMLEMVECSRNAIHYICKDN